MSEIPPVPDPNVPPPFQGGYVQPQPVMQYPEASQALLALILSIVSFVACSGLISPVAWYLGSNELTGIDAGRRDPANRDMARAAKILGIIGTVLIGLAILAFGAFIIFAIVAGSASSVS